MEPEPPPQGVGGPAYAVLWHPQIKKDLGRINPAQVETIVRVAEDRLSRAPHLSGQPLKGTTHLLWKLRFSKYRVVYTLRPRTREVWILSVQGRDEVYRPPHIQSLLKLAVALHEQTRQSR